MQQLSPFCVGSNQLAVLMRLKLVLLLVELVDDGALAFEVWDALGHFDRRASRASVDRVEGRDVGRSGHGLAARSPCERDVAVAKGFLGRAHLLRRNHLPGGHGPTGIF